ncbi:MAG: hypothetical protein ACRDZ3_16150 [Acidimicrobiia bacterium]
MIRSSYRRWREWRIGLVTTARWVLAGVPLRAIGSYVGSEFALSEARAWRRAGFRFTDIDAYLDHKISLEEACAWRDRGFDTATATEWGRYRLTPGDHARWTAAGYRAQAAFYWISCEVAPDRADSYYATGGLPPEMFGGASGGWYGQLPARGAPPDLRVSWDDDEDGPRPRWWD